MSQADFVISNSDANTGLTYRAAVDAALQALASSNSGATEPSVMYAGQIWADTGNTLLKMRNQANDAWITIGTLDAANLALLSLAGGTMTGLLTLSGDPTAALHAVTARMIQKGSLVYIADTGVADAYVAILAPVVAAYTTGMEVRVKIINANATTTPTLNVNALGAKVIKRGNSAALLVGDLPANHQAVLRYNGTDFILLNPALHDHLSADKGGTLVGRTVQAVHSSTSAVSTTAVEIPADDSIPQNTEGVELLTATITPKNTNNKLVIEVVALLHDDGGAGAGGVAAIFQDTTANALAATYADTVDGATTVVLRYEMTAGTTSSTTFKLRVGPRTGAGTLTVNGVSGGRYFGGVASTTLRVTEVQV